MMVMVMEMVMAQMMRHHHHNHEEMNAMIAVWIHYSFHLHQRIHENHENDEEMVHTVVVVDVSHDLLQASILIDVSIVWQKHS